METSKEHVEDSLEGVKKLLAQAKTALEQGCLAEAETAAREAGRIDPVNPVPLEVLARVLEAQGRHETAEEAAKQAKALRKAAWKRQVEAELRGQHEWMGSSIRHKTP